MVYAADDPERQRHCDEVSGIVEDINRPDGGPVSRPYSIRTASG